MNLQITAQQCDPSEEIRERARELAERWPKYESATTAARLVFKIQGQTHVVEALVSRNRQDPVVAAGEGGDFRAALDEVDERVRRILRKDHQRRKKHHQARSPEQMG